MLKTRTFFWAVTTVLLILTACSKDEGLGDQGGCAICNVTEQTNIQISGDLDIVDFTESLQNDASNDLIDYTFFGNPASRFNFIIQLQSGWKLTLELNDENNSNPWEQVDQSFNAYPGKNLNELSRYIRATLSKGTESIDYSTNPGSGVSPSTHFGVFKITALSSAEINGRLRDLILYKVSNPASTINVNGTFVGAVTFE